MINRQAKGYFRQLKADLCWFFEIEKAAPQRDSLS
jgi:hypothetical protein